MVYFVTLGGVFFDLFAGFGLLFPRGIIFYFTLASCVFFHVSNKLLFNIGIFPMVMLASTTLFFEPDWIYKLLPFLPGRSPPSALKKFRGPLSFRKKVRPFFLFLFLVFL